mmetsp:Transcript_1029/g.2335  ORF Transcript_1029/g.2335 Transcript_1029/m.2335 type:complete len:285 (+) Transcript_1029:3189-4043(+)
MELHQPLGGGPRLVLAGGHHVEPFLPPPPELLVPGRHKLPPVQVLLLSQLKPLGQNLPRRAVKVLGLHHHEVHLRPENLLSNAALKLPQLEGLGGDRILHQLPRPAPLLVPLPRGHQLFQVHEGPRHRPVPPAARLPVRHPGDRLRDLPGRALTHHVAWALAGLHKTLRDAAGRQQGGLGKTLQLGLVLHPNAHPNLLGPHLLRLHLLDLLGHGNAVGAVLEAGLRRLFSRSFGLGLLLLLLPLQRVLLLHPVHHLLHAEELRLHGRLLLGGHLGLGLLLSPRR